MNKLRDITYPVIAPSLLSADKNNLASECLKAQNAGCKYIHIDIMDGKFVPNVSFSTQVVEEIHDKHNMVNDVHIMIEKPYLFAEDYVKAGADIVTFHLEACETEELAHKTIEIIKNAGAIPGISIKPNTEVCAIEPFINEVGLILLMSVEPGKGGQAFIIDSLDRLKAIKAIIEEIPEEDRPVIEIDGGINDKTAPLALAYGAEAMVAGSYLYGHEDFKERVERLVDNKCQIKQ